MRGVLGWKSGSKGQHGSTSICWTEETLRTTSDVLYMCLRVYGNGKAEGFL